MEFNNSVIKETSSTTSSEVVEEKVTLKSTERATISSIPNALKITVSAKDSETILFSHDITDTLNMFDKKNIKTSLISIYGKDGKVHTSSKNVEAVSILLSQFPARLEYKLVVADSGVEVEYTADYLISSTPSTVSLSLVGKSTSSTSELTLKNAIIGLDESLIKIKTNLENFSYIVLPNTNKVVSLHSYISILNSKIDKLTKDLEDAKKEIKDLQEV